GLAGHVLAVARERGAPRAVVWGVTGWMVASPVFGMHAIAVGRDASFAVVGLWVTALLLRVTELGAVTPLTGAWLGVALALLSLLRHNGAAVAVVVLVFLAGPFRRAPRGVVTALATCVTM